MNLKKAKKLRKEVYGSDSKRIREYIVDISTGQIRNVSLRSHYQQMKKGIKK